MWSIAIWIIKNMKKMMQSQTQSIINTIQTGSSDVSIVDTLPGTDGIYLIYQDVDLT